MSFLSSLREHDIALFQQIGAGHSANPATLAVMAWLANNGPWLCVAAMAWFAWRVKDRRGFLLYVLVSAGIAALAAHEAAAWIDLPRPFAIGLSPNYVDHGARGSLPSAHATVMFTIALMCLWRQGLRWLGAILFAIAALNGWARVYVGAHFPFDVVGGLVLGAVLACVLMLCALLWRKARSKAGTRTVEG